MFARVPMIMAIVGIGGGIVCVLAAMFGGARVAFFNAYLVGYLFWLGISLGSLAILLVHNLTGGEWGWVVRRIADAAARVLPLMRVLFIPIALGVRDLFPWARGTEVAVSELLRHREAYLNVPFFVARAVIYFSLGLQLRGSLGQR